jgi:RNA polymerase sigma factor (sigma-70 family)
MGSVTNLISALQDGRDGAFEGLCKRLLPWLTSYADRRCGVLGVGLDDGEDIAQGVFLSLWRAVADQRPVVTRLSDRSSLCRVLVMLTGQKLRRSLRDGTRKKRDYRRTLRLSGAVADGAGFRYASPAAAPEAEADLVARETVDEWLSPLTEEQRVIASLKLVAATNREIAAHLGISLRSVERELSIIRSVWGERYEAIAGHPPR